MVMAKIGDIGIKTITKISINLWAASPKKDKYEVQIENKSKEKKDKEVSVDKIWDAKGAVTADSIKICIIIRKYFQILCSPYWEI